MNNDPKNISDKAKEALSNIWQKTSDTAKKVASDIHKNATAFSEKRQQAIYEQQMKKYRPLTAKEFKSKNFKIPNVIEIVDDAVRRNIEVCEGAIGWLEDHKGVEVLHLYDEYVEKSGLSFIPSVQCDNIYCVDNFNRNDFTNTGYVFAKTNEEKLAELANIAHALGAKSCSIEIMESNSDMSSASNSVKSKFLGTETSMSKGNANKSSGKRMLNFSGNNTPKRPQLKWFAHDENIKGLIDMRCTDINSIKSTVIELSGSSCATMSKKVACAIDSISKISGSMSMEAQSTKEHESKLVLAIEFN